MLLRIRAIGLLLCVALAGCKSGGDENPAARAILVDTGADPNVIQYEFTDAIATIERRMLIDQSGRVRVVQITGTDQENRLSADTNLTKEQRDQLLKAFEGWNQLKPFYPTYFGPIFSITFNGHKVEGADSEGMPGSLRRAKNMLDVVAIAALRTAPRPTLPAQESAAPPVEQVVYILNSDIEYQYTFTVVPGEVVRRKITVSKEEGLLRVSEETTGPEPQNPPVNAKIHLSQNQLITLASTMRYLPEGDQRYPGLEDGPYFMIKYGGRSIISGGLDAPAAVKSTQLLLEDYAMDAKRFPEPD